MHVFEFENHETSNILITRMFYKKRQLRMTRKYGDRNMSFVGKKYSYS